MPHSGKLDETVWPASLEQTNHQLPIHLAWENQTRAQINLVLTWATPDVKGIICGKFNEYVMARKPILCLISGDRDEELEGIYHKLPNSLLACNREEEKNRIRAFVLDHFRSWQEKGRVEEIPEDILDSYDCRTDNGHGRIFDAGQHLKCCNSLNSP
jgi:hypothetical protein